MYKRQAIRGIELNDAVIVVDLDDDNRVDFVPASPDINKPLSEVEQRPKAPKKTTLERQEELGKKVRNFNCCLLYTSPLRGVRSFFLVIYTSV